MLCGSMAAHRAASEPQAGTEFGEAFLGQSFDLEKVVERRERAFPDNGLGDFRGKALHGGQFLNARSID